MTVHDLRATIRDRLLGVDASHLAVQLKSFGFKRGLPLDADLVYDLRMLPNPHWQKELRSQTGLDKGVQDFLGKQADVKLMHDNILLYLQTWLPKIEASNRSYFTIAIGCTGGQHRSVYMVDALAEALCESYPNIQVRHRELQQ